MHHLCKVDLIPCDLHLPFCKTSAEDNRYCICPKAYPLFLCVWSWWLHGSALITAGAALMRRSSGLQRHLCSLWSDKLTLSEALAGSMLHLRGWRVLKSGGRTGERC